MKVMLIGTASSYVAQRELDRLVTEVETLVGRVEHISAITRDGIGRMEAYDIVSTPAWLVVKDDGAPIGVWQHTTPTINELTAHFHI